MCVLQPYEELHTPSALRRKMLSWFPREQSCSVSLALTQLLFQLTSAQHLILHPSVILQSNPFHITCKHDDSTLLFYCTHTCVCLWDSFTASLSWMSGFWVLLYRFSSQNDKHPLHLVSSQLFLVNPAAQDRIKVSRPHFHSDSRIKRPRGASAQADVTPESGTEILNIFSSWSCLYNSSHSPQTRMWMLRSFPSFSTEFSMLSRGRSWFTGLSWCFRHLFMHLEPAGFQKRQRCMRQLEGFTSTNGEVFKIRLPVITSGGFMECSRAGLKLWSVPSQYEQTDSHESIRCVCLDAVWRAVERRVES